MVTQLVAATLMAFAVLTAAALAVLAWRQRPRPGAVPFAAIMLAVTAWVGAYSIGFWSTGLEAKLFWYRLEWLGVVSLPVAWIGFAAEYTGRDRYLTPRYVALLSVVPALTVLLAWTNPAHHLVLTSASVVTYGEFAVLERNWGPWFWVHIVYSYSLLVAGAALLFRLVVDSRTLYRGQATALLVAVGAPWVGNVAYVTDLTGLPGFDPTPFTFVISGVMGLGALTQFQLLDAIPVLDRTAQNFVIEAMDDGVVVVDADDRIVNLNPQAERLLGDEGFDVGDTLPATYTDRGATGADEGEDGDAAIPFAVDGTERYFEVDVSELRDYHDRVTGRVVVFHDVTERLTREQRLSVLSRVLRHNLRNEMNVVYGYADGLSVESPADEAAVDLIKRKALTLVEQGSKAREIQEFLENGDPGGDPVDLGAAVRSVVARTRDAYPDVAFELDCPDEETACPAVVESVVENLVTNAAKHNTDPDPVVSVTARRDGADVLVSVVDNGPGIPDEERAVLESGRETSLEHGSGLGLWFVTWAVDHAGGGVSFEETDSGSAVTVRLPRRPAV